MMSEEATMKRSALAFIACALFAGTSLVGLAPAAAADGCVTRAEYEALEWGLTPNQIENRFETNGWFIGITENGDFFKRGYDPCWTNDRKVVIWYDLNLGLSDHWDIRDR